MKDLTKEVLINGVPYYVKYGTLSMIAYGKLTGNTVGSLSNLSGMQIDDMYKLYYSGIVAGCQLKNIPCLSYEDFLLATEGDEAIMATLIELRNDDVPKEGN